MELNNTFTKVDFNQYRDAYDKDVIQAWKRRVQELDAETLRALMYGFTFTSDYAEGNLEDSFFMDFWKEKSFELELESDSYNDIDDAIEETMNNVMEDDYMVDTPQERLLMKTIDSTGDGKSPETAFCVIDVHQEYEYIERKFPFCCLKMTKQSVRNGIDCLHFEENPFDIDCIYFDISRRFEVGYPGCKGDA